MPDVNGFLIRGTEDRAPYIPRTPDYSNTDWQEWALIGPIAQTLLDSVNDCWRNFWMYGEAKEWKLRGLRLDVLSTFSASEEQFQFIQGQIYHYLTIELYERVIARLGDPGPAPSAESPLWDTSPPQTIQIWNLQKKYTDAQAGRVEIRGKSGIIVNP